MKDDDYVKWLFCNDQRDGRT